MSSEKKSHQILLKLVFAGKHGAGKTSLLARQADNTFTKDWLATIGVDFKLKKYSIGNIVAKTQLWDTAGQQRFRSIQRPYYKGANAILLCFDLSDKDSFINLQKQIADIRGLNLQTLQIYLIGCKSDLQPSVFTDQILIYSQRNNCQYFQTSSKQDEGVHQCFKAIVQDCTQRQLQMMAFQKPQCKVNIQNKQVKPFKKTCC